MDSSRILRYTEERSGNTDDESGWTTYIASPIQESHHHHDDDDRSTDMLADYEKSNYGKNEDSESDDSMASDASSGPSNQEIPCAIIAKSVGTCSSKHATAKFSSRGKLHKQIKQSAGACPRILEKQESFADAKSAASDVHDGNKVRKTKKEEICSQVSVYTRMQPSFL